MGVKGLWQLLLPTGRRISIETLSGKNLAIDASIWLTQFLKANRDPETGKVRANAHLIGFLRRICKLLYHGIRPVFVFDGATPEIKLREIRNRRERRERLNQFKSEDGDVNGSNEGVKRLARRLFVAQLKKQKELEKAVEDMAKDDPKKKKVKDPLAAIKYATRKSAKTTGAFASGFRLPGQEAQEEKQGDEMEEKDDDADNANETAVNANENTVVASNKDNEEDDVLILSDSEDYLKTLTQEQKRNNNDWDNALAAAESDNDSDSDNQSDENNSHNNTNTNTIQLPKDERDLDIDALAHLPSKSRVDIIEQARRQQRMRSRNEFMSVAANPDSYSQCQLKNFLKSANLNKRVNLLGKKVAMKGDGDGLDGERIASDGSRRFIFTKDGDGNGDGDENEVKTWRSARDDKGSGMRLKRARLSRGTGSGKDKHNDNDNDDDDIFSSMNHANAQTNREQTMTSVDLFGDDSDDSYDGGGFIVEEHKSQDKIQNLPRPHLTIASSDESDNGGDGGGFITDGKKQEHISIDLSDESDLDVDADSDADENDNGGGFICVDDKKGNECISIASSSDESNNDFGEGGGFVVNEKNQQEVITIASGSSKDTDVAGDDDDDNQGGGFIVGDVDDEGGGGGFIVEEKNDSNLINAPNAESDADSEQAGGFIVEEKKPELITIASSDESDDSGGDCRDAAVGGGEFIVVDKMNDNAVSPSNNKGEITAEKNDIDSNGSGNDGGFVEEFIVRERRKENTCHKASIANLRAGDTIPSSSKIINAENLDNDAESQDGSVTLTRNNADAHESIDERIDVGSTKVITAEKSVSDPPSEGENSDSDIEWEDGDAGADDAKDEPNKLQTNRQEVNNGAPSSPQLDESHESEVESVIWEDVDHGEIAQSDESNNELTTKMDEDDTASQNSDYLIQPASGSNNTTMFESSNDFQKKDANTMALRNAQATASHLTDWAGRAVQRAIKAHLGDSIADTGDVSDDDSDESVEIESPAEESTSIVILDDDPETNKGSNGKRIGNQEAGLEEDSKENDRSQPHEFMDTSLDALRREDAMLRDEENRRERDMDTVTDEMVEEVMQLLQLFGIPYLRAPAEAEAQCAELEKIGLVDGVVTEDSDAIVFGSRSVYRNIFDDKKYVEVYLASDSEAIGLGLNEKIALAMLLGGDYTEGVKGVGIVNGMEILKAFPMTAGIHEGLVAFRKWLDGFDFDFGDGENEGEETNPHIAEFQRKHKTARSRWIVPKGFPAANVLQAYSKPVVDSSENVFSWGIPDLEALRIFCSRKMGWEESETERTIVPVINEMSKGMRQMRLDGYFMKVEDKIKFADVKSKRLREVWNLKKEKSADTKND